MSWAVVFLSTFYYFCEWQMSNILRIFTITMDQELELLSTELSSKGYKTTAIQMDALETFLSMFLTSPLIILTIASYLFFNYPESIKGASNYQGWEMIAFIIPLAIVHELTHGICFAISAKDGFKNVSFGFSKKIFCPYCHCNTAINARGYIIAALMPGIIWGIVPAALSVIYCNPHLLSFSILGIGGASCDVYCVLTLLKISNHNTDSLVYDYRNSVGFALFYKDK